jgi:hypothetical protein
VTTRSTSARPRPGLEAWAGLGGALYVLLFIVGAIVAFGGQPDLDADPATVEAYFSDAGHRDRIVLGWILIGLGLFFFLWFLASLRQALRRLDPGGFWANLASIGGVVYAALSLASISLSTGIKTMSDDTYRDTVYPELIHAADDAGYVMHATGGVGAGAMMIGGSIAALRAGVIPAWLGWVGAVAGILALGSIAFFPQFLIALWVLVAGIMLFLANPGSGRRPEDAVAR